MSQLAALLKTAWPHISALGVVGTIAGLMAGHVVDASAGLPVLVTFGGVAVGAGAVKSASPTASVTVKGTSTNG